MEDDDEKAVQRMLIYLYSLDYDDKEPAEACQSDSDPSTYATSSASAAVSNLNTNAKHHRLEQAAAMGQRMKAAIQQRIMSNISVYAIADKYDIPQLKILAKSKFQALVHSKWPFDDFPAIIKATFGTSPLEDGGLKEVVLGICAVHIDEIMKNEELASAITEIGPLCFGLMQKALINRNDIKQELDRVLGELSKSKLQTFWALSRQANMKVELSKSVPQASETLSRESALKMNLSKSTSQASEDLARESALEVNLAKSRSEASQALEQNRRWDARLSEIVSNVDQVKECRKCSKDFTFRIERQGIAAFVPMQLRCSECKCRHDL